MKESLTEVVIILDQSGSMASLKKETVKAFNNFLDEQKELPGEVFFTAALFNDSYKLLHDRVDIKRAEPMTDNNFLPRGRSALNDAFGKTIDDIGYALNATPEPERPGKVVIIVIADGGDNAGSLYSREKLAAMVGLQIKTYSWEFLFFDVNTDSQSAAALAGIPADRAFPAGDFEGIACVFKAASAAVRDLRKHRTYTPGIFPISGT